VALSDDIFELLRTPLSGQHLIGHKSPKILRFCESENRGVTCLSHGAAAFKNDKKRDVRRFKINEFYSEQLSENFFVSSEGKA
jgi:hypothetical protein